MENECQINSIQDFINVVDEWEMESPQFGKPHWIWFRGQPDASSAPKPGAMRSEFLEAAKNLLGSDTGIQLERIVFSQFRQRGTPYFKNPCDLVTAYFRAQHYGLPTRLLDWTTNPLAALYFAASKNIEMPGKLFVGKFHQLTQGAALEWQSGNILKGCIEHILGEGQPPTNAKIIPVMPDWNDPRMIQQSSCFTLHLPDSPDFDFGASHIGGNKSPSSYEVPALSKEEIQRQLRRLGVHHGSLFPELDSIADDIRRIYRLS